MHGAQNAVAPERAMTLNERISKALNTLGYQCDRLESVLNRVNGTPSKLEAAIKGNVPAPHSSLQHNVDRMEQEVERLLELANGVERIA